MPCGACCLTMRVKVAEQSVLCAPRRNGEKAPLSLRSRKAHPNSTLQNPQKTFTHVCVGCVSELLARYEVSQPSFFLSRPASMVALAPPRGHKTPCLLEAAQQSSKPPQGQIQRCICLTARVCAQPRTDPQEMSAVTTGVRQADQLSQMIRLTKQIRVGLKLSVNILKAYMTI
jgi:hypothetical protein